MAKRTCMSRMELTLVAQVRWQGCSECRCAALAVATSRDLRCGNMQNLQLLCVAGFCSLSFGNQRCTGKACKRTGPLRCHVVLQPALASLLATQAAQLEYVPSMLRMQAQICKWQLSAIASGQCGVCA